MISWVGSWSLISYIPGRSSSHLPSEGGCDSMLVCEDAGSDTDTTEHEIGKTEHKGNEPILLTIVGGLSNGDLLGDDISRLDRDLFLQFFRGRNDGWER